MNSIIKLLRPLIGKNVASLVRSLITLLGGLVGGHGAMEAVNTADGLQLFEVGQILIGLGLMFTSSFINWIRARKLAGRSLSPLAEYIGPIMGRSVHSGVRRIMTLIAGAIISVGAAQAGASESEIANIEVSELVTSAVIFGLMRVYSYFQEGKQV